MNISFFRKKSPGFTLVELLIAVTISAFLFVGILVFVSSSMRQSITQEKILKNLTQKWDFSDSLYETLGKSKKIVWSGSIGNGSGILLRTNDSKSIFTLLSSESFTGLCDSFSGTANASGTGMRLSIKKFIPASTHTTWWPYTLSQSGNMIYSGGVWVIGTGHPGDTLTFSWETTELRYPSALVWSGNILYIADTLNNRILGYNTTMKQISQILGNKDGISLPTDLSLSWNTLLIANAGGWNILSYQDWSENPTQFSSDFKVSKAFHFTSIWFDADTGAILGGATGTGNYSFSGMTKTIDDSVNSNPLIYTFSWGQDLSANTLYKISVDSITGAPISLGSHSIRITFYSGATMIYQDSLPWYTLGDGDILTSTGNVLSILDEGLTFPNNLQASSWSGSLDYATLINSPLQTITSRLPIENFSFWIKNNILTIQWDEYDYYDCLTEKHQMRHLIFKQKMR
jgi:prepilin-type N-terminal cleavage/methylation domain-containing protein